MAGMSSIQASSHSWKLSSPPLHMSGSPGIYFNPSTYYMDAFLCEPSGHRATWEQEWSSILQCSSPTHSWHPQRLHHVPTTVWSCLCVISVNPHLWSRVYCYSWLTDSLQIFIEFLLSNLILRIVNKSDALPALTKFSFFWDGRKMGK